MSKSISLVVTFLDEQIKLYSLPTFSELQSELAAALDLEQQPFKLFYHDELDRQFLIANDSTYQRALASAVQELEMTIKPDPVTRAEIHPRTSLNDNTVKKNINSFHSTYQFEIQENFWSSCGRDYHSELDECPNWLPEPLIAETWTWQHCSMENSENLNHCQMCENPQKSEEHVENKEVNMLVTYDWTCTWAATNPPNCVVCQRCSFNRKFWNCTICYGKQPYYVLTCPQCRKGMIFTPNTNTKPLFCCKWSKQGAAICAAWRERYPLECKAWKYCKQEYMTEDQNSNMWELCYAKLLEGASPSPKVKSIK